MKDSVNVKDKKWEFDEEVTACFDDMLSRSIPEYETMRDLVTRIACNYLKVNTTIMDIGCSNGNAVAPICKKYGDSCKYLLLDISDPMLEECKKRLGYLDIRKHDLRGGVPKADCSVVLSILTIQFVPIEYRQKIIQSIYDNLIDGGAFIFVEKVLGNTNEIDELFVKEYYKIKSENAYTWEQIKDKRKSLEGVLVPVTARWNEDLLKQVGFRKVDCFYRFLNFAGWIGIK